MHPVPVDTAFLAAILATLNRDIHRHSTNNNHLNMETIRTVLRIPVDMVLAILHKVEVVILIKVAVVIHHRILAIQELEVIHHRVVTRVLNQVLLVAVSCPMIPGCNG